MAINAQLIIHRYAAKQWDTIIEIRELAMYYEIPLPKIVSCAAFEAYEKKGDDISAVEMYRTLECLQPFMIWETTKRAMVKVSVSHRLRLPHSLVWRSMQL